MDHFEIRWYNAETKKWNIDYSSYIEEKVMFFSSEENENKFNYICAKDLGKEMHNLFEKLFTTIFSKTINVANMSIMSSEDSDEYIHGEFDIIIPDEIS